MKNNLMEAYKNLSLNDKRNEYSSEIILLYNIIESYLNMFNTKSNYKPYNYNSSQDISLTEDETLTLYYSDLLEIKNNLLLLLSLIENKEQL